VLPSRSPLGRVSDARRLYRTGIAAAIGFGPSV